MLSPHWSKNQRQRANANMNAKQFTDNSPRQFGVQSMKSIFQFRVHLNSSILAIAGLALLGCLMARPAALAADDAAASAKAASSTDKKEKSDDSEAKKRKSEADAATAKESQPSHNGKADH